MDLKTYLLTHMKISEITLNQLRKIHGETSAMDIIARAQMDNFTFIRELISNWELENPRAELK